MEKNYKTKKEEMKNEKTAGYAIVFENPEFGKIRTLTDENGEPLFCAKDVCDVLGYKRARCAVYQLVNPHDAVKHSIRVTTGIKKDGSEAKRWCQLLFVNESGFYALVLGAGVEPPALCPSYPVLPERPVSALCRLCPHGPGEEPHPLLYPPRPSLRWGTGEAGHRLHPHLPRMDRKRKKVHTLKGKKVKK